MAKTGIAGKPIGSGSNFAKGVADITKKGTSKKEAEAIMAEQGRKKYGKGAFQKMAEKGKK